MKKHCCTKVVNSLLSVSSCRRRPCLILKDVLKTEQGRTYMERIKHRRTLGNGGKVTSTRRESDRSRDDLICKETRSNQREAGTSTNNSVTPKCNQKTSTSLSPRLVYPVVSSLFFNSVSLVKIYVHSLHRAWITVTPGILVLTRL